MEKCVRCGKNGRDRRTLWMAALYDMGAKSVGIKAVPYIQRAIKGICQVVSGKDQYNNNIWKDDPDAKPDQTHLFFTLRVCKRCRTDWLVAQRDWFYARPSHDDGFDDEDT